MTNPLTEKLVETCGVGAVPTFVESVEVPYQVRLLAERVKHFEDLCEAEKKALKNAKQPDCDKMSTAHLQANVWRSALVLVIESFGLEPGKVIAQLQSDL